MKLNWIQVLFTVIILSAIASICLAADAGFNDIPTTPANAIETMYWQAPKMRTSTGTLTCDLITNPGVAINAGTTYYYFVPGQSILSVAPNQSLTVTVGKTIHAFWSVLYYIYP